MDKNPTNAALNGDHGTSVAGLIGAVPNTIGGIGVAPYALLAGYNLLSSAGSSLDTIQSLGGATGTPFNSSDVLVFNQSYGYDNKDDFLVDPAVESQLHDGVTNLRGGKGAIYVKAAGNGYEDFTTGTVCDQAKVVGVGCQNANMDPENALPWNLVVGALNADGLRSSYSTPGAALWISAPGGEYGYNLSEGWTAPPENPHYIFEPAMVTTDQSGCSQGYSRSGLTPLPGNDFEDGNVDNPSCNYTSTFNGTSSATPVTSGAIALILEANPNLTWRAVRRVLADTAVQVDPSQTGLTYGPVTGIISGAYQVEQGWITNAAGYHFHDWYGFGRIDVQAAVAAARAFPAGSLGTFQDSGFISSGAISLSIPDGSPTGVTSTVNVTTNLTIEAVQIKVSVTHPLISDLAIELSSPTGTRSILLTAYNGFASANLSGVVLLSNAFYGESSTGTWTIKVVDAYSVDTGTLTNWQIRVYGH
jgi:hypothetical protein